MGPPDGKMKSQSFGNMQKKKIKELLQGEPQDNVTVFGWVRTLRDQKSFAFIEINDGSTFGNLQIVLDSQCPNFVYLIKELTTGASVRVMGKLIKSPGKNQALELRASEIEIIGPCNAEKYPLQKKRHTFEFLRTIAHLRPRTNTQGAVLRVRSALALATHGFFQERGFLYIQTPIITTSDCEGGGQQFAVTSFKLDQVPRLPDGGVDFTKDFFQRPTYLTVSGQLNTEAVACALCDVYTFGPTFRAENSNTSRHLAEFWMIEPEM